MNARQYLRQANVINRKVNNKLMEKYKLEELAKGLTASIGGERVQTSLKPDRMAEIAIKIVEAEEEIDTLVSQLLSTRQEIIQVIDSLESQQLSDVLHNLYIQDKSLTETAEVMHLSVDWTKHLSQKAVKEVQKIKKFEN